MPEAGQGNGVATPAVRSQLDADGYIMVVLLIGMAVAAIWMGAMLPSWQQQATREKEADLVYRGEQYARAIALYRRKNQNLLPQTIDQLVSQRYLRKKYKDPVTGKDFVPVMAQGVGGAPSGIMGVRSQSNATSIRIYRNQQVYSQFQFDFQNVPIGTPPATNQPPGGAPGGGNRSGPAPPGGGTRGPAAPGGVNGPLVPGGGNRGLPGANTPRGGTPPNQPTAPPRGGGR